MNRRMLLKVVGAGMGSTGLLGTGFVNAVVASDEDYDCDETVEIVVTSSGDTEEVPAAWYERIQRAENVTTRLVRDYLGKEWVERISESSGDELICDSHSHPEVHVFVTDMERAQNEFPSEIEGIPIVIRDADERPEAELLIGESRGGDESDVIPFVVAGTGAVGLGYALHRWREGLK